MSPDERADTVCSGTAAYRQRKSSLADLNNRILATEHLLATGYRVYEYCQIVPVSIPARSADCSGLAGDELEACKKNNRPATIENRRVCQQRPVPIDYNYESDILRNLRMARADQLDVHEQQTSDCVARAWSLPADDAYLLYKNNAEP
ncbi:MAG TPA: hypothetical protein VIV27_00930 [Halioglobus sp.]